VEWWRRRFSSCGWEVARAWARRRKAAARRRMRRGGGGAESRRRRHGGCGAEAEARRLRRGGCGSGSRWRRACGGVRRCAVRCVGQRAIGSAALVTLTRWAHFGGGCSVSEPCCRATMKHAAGEPRRKTCHVRQQAVPRRERHAVSGQWALIAVGVWAACERWRRGRSVRRRGGSGSGCPGTWCQRERADRGG
jgi:hypothetical protein